jgi:hypothetical protein
MSLTPPPLRSGSVPATSSATAGMGGARPLPPNPPTRTAFHPVRVRHGYGLKKNCGRDHVQKRFRPGGFGETAAPGLSFGASPGLSFGASPGLSFGSAPGLSLGSRPRFVVWVPPQVCRLGPEPKRRHPYALPAGGFGGSGLAPPMPAVAELVAGTEPERSGGGVRLMLNRVSH